MPGPWGKALEALRVSKRLTRAAMAKRAKMTPTSYGRLEKGLHTQTRKLQDIADEFGVPIEDVLVTKTLRSDPASGNTAPSYPAQAKYEQRRSVQAIDPAAAMQELQTQVNVLQRELATLVAEREANRRRRQRLSATRNRKQVRSGNARKTR